MGNFAALRGGNELVLPFSAELKTFRLSPQPGELRGYARVASSMSHHWEALDKHSEKFYNTLVTREPVPSSQRFWDFLESIETLKHKFAHHWCQEVRPLQIQLK